MKKITLFYLLLMSVIFCSCKKQLNSVELPAKEERVPIVELMTNDPHRYGYYEISLNTFLQLKNVRILPGNENKIATTLSEFTIYRKGETSATFLKRNKKANNARQSITSGLYYGYDVNTNRCICSGTVSIYDQSPNNNLLDDTCDRPGFESDGAIGYTYIEGLEISGNGSFFSSYAFFGGNDIAIAISHQGIYDIYFADLVGHVVEGWIEPVN